MEGYKYVQNEKGIMVPRIEQDRAGLVQRCARKMVELVEKAKKTRQVRIAVSFLEIYNERIYDLLNGSIFRYKKNATS